MRISVIGCGYLGAVHAASMAELGHEVVGMSTVPVGTAARLAELVTERIPGALLAWNPEFLREGFAVQDTLEPDRLVYGLPEGTEAETARKMLVDVYAAIV